MKSPHHLQVHLHVGTITNAVNKLHMSMTSCTGSYTINKCDDTCLRTHMKTDQNIRMMHCNQATKQCKGLGFNNISIATMKKTHRLAQEKPANSLREGSWKKENPQVSLSEQLP